MSWVVSTLGFWLGILVRWPIEIVPFMDDDLRLYIFGNQWLYYHYMRVSMNGGTSKWRYTMENASKLDDL